MTKEKKWDGLCEVVGICEGANMTGSKLQSKKKEMKDRQAQIHQPGCDCCKVIEG